MQNVAEYSCIWQLSSHKVCLKGDPFLFGNSENIRIFLAINNKLPKKKSIIKADNCLKDNQLHTSKHEPTFADCSIKDTVYKMSAK